MTEPLTAADFALSLTRFILDNPKWAGKAIVLKVKDETCYVKLDFRKHEDTLEITFDPPPMRHK